MSRIIAVDVDGVLTKEICWTPEECLNAEPNKGIIKMVERLYKENFIVIYTARTDELIVPTLQWLRKNEVKFNAFSNNKMAADLYIDDKAFNPVRPKHRR